MDSYKVVLSDLAKSQLNDYVNYIQYTLLNDQAAGAVLDDALETIDVGKRIIERSARSVSEEENEAADIVFRVFLRIFMYILTNN